MKKFIGFLMVLVFTLASCGGVVSQQGATPIPDAKSQPAVSAVVDVPAGVKQIKVDLPVRIDDRRPVQESSWYKSGWTWLGVGVAVVLGGIIIGMSRNGDVRVGNPAFNHNGNGR